MMRARDVWAPLAAGSRDNRVVVRTAGGKEVDVKSVTTYAQLCVIETDESVDTGVRSDREFVTPEQLSELLDANTADVDECTKMLAELENRGITSLFDLIDRLYRSECTE